MVALTKENQDTDVCEFVANERTELATLTGEFNGNRIGHGSTCLVLEDISIHIYDEVNSIWVEL